ncbi:SDR family NAD(P)-dependent oxidoreductase, partial [Streptomyces sp. CA2R106]|uniref:SDR family NAD(P)-dependent oxidoreductase n=1 Tax=Streptomyces sp. CA2R106 TaxID=3120153 RepID=UPI003008DF99
GLSLEDAARVVALRSKLVLERLAGLGGMVSVGLPAEEVAALIAPYEGRVSIAAVNSPRSVVVSGEAELLGELVEQWQHAGVRARRVPVDYASHSAQVGIMEDELLDVLAPLAPRPGRVPFYSTATGDFIGTEGLDGAYWYANLRGQVGFESAVRALAGQGAGRFLEMSPHPVLVSAVTETVQEVEGSELVRVVGSLRRGEGGLGRFAMSLAEAHVAGATVDWAAFYAGTGAQRVDLPGYAFQRSRYWLPVAAGGGGDLTGAGLAAFGHPMLSAAVRVGDRDEWVLTGRVSPEAQPWTQDHAVFGMVIVPGVALAELALAAGRKVDCPVVEELVLQVPLLLAEDEARDLQVTVGAPDDDGRRDLAIYTAPSEKEGREQAQPICHARGTLTPDAGLPADTDWARAWPPQDAEPVAVDALYERLAGLGYDYGPSFKALHTAWEQDEYVYAEAALPDEHVSSARQYGIHPGLLDSSLHSGLSWLDKGGDHAAQLPFSWSGVRLGIPGSSRVRVRITSTADSTLRVDITDEQGELVISADQLAFRPVDRNQLEGARRPDTGALYTVDWSPVAPAADAVRPQVAALGELTGAGEQFADLAALTAAVAAGTAVPGTVVAAVPDDAAGSVQAVAARTLELVQEWLAADALAESRLVLVSRGAVSTAGEAPDVAAAAAWGLVRSAQSEHPGRFGLLDLDPAGEIAGAAPDWAALTLHADEPQVAVRGGQVLAPRLAKATASTTLGALTPAAADGAVLVTGGTGGLGALVARHLATEGGVRHLVLVSRSGLGAPGAADLAAELADAGCRVEVMACDVADREQLTELISSLDAPLVGVVHAAGVLDDGLLASMTSEQLERVVRPKLESALLLDELTTGMDVR